jgi:hypothetical protein
MARGKGRGRARDNPVRSHASPAKPLGAASGSLISAGVGDDVPARDGVRSEGGAARGPHEIADIGTASLAELKARYPEQWELTGRALVTALEARHAAGAAKFLARTRAEAVPWRLRVKKSGGNPQVVQAALPALVRERMSQLAVRQAVDSAVAVRASGGDGARGRTGTSPRSLRFGLWSGTLVQRLFFRRGLERKPVAMGWFRLLWPLVTEKALLLPLCEPKGIYCFYARPLLDGLGALIRDVGPGLALEIAAGDGTLSRFLTAAGTPVQASDDHSWSHSIAFPSEVERLDAATALSRHAPRVVICSWPPPGNGFERFVFRTPSVARYIVITTRHRFAAGSWAAYDDAQVAFDRRSDDRLSQLVLPPEIDPVVLVFDRR